MTHYGGELHHGCMLSKQAVEEYGKIYFAKYGKKLTDEEALEQADNLLNLYKAVYFENSATTAVKKNDEKKT